MSFLSTNQQNRVLILSALFASAFALGGLVLGLIADSLVILFDGFYSLVSLLLTLLSLAVARYIQQPSKSSFPFGKAMLEPAVIAIKGMVILSVVAVSLYNATIDLFNGGRAIESTIAVLFGVINVIGCGFTWWYLQKKNQRLACGLIDAEVKQWKMDTVLSIAVTLGFIVAWIISHSSSSQYAVYADPVMMCLISVYFIKVPLLMLKDALRELLMMRPSEEICTKVDEGMRAVSRVREHDIELIGLTKIGRELRVDVTIKTRPNTAILPKEIEHTRCALAGHLAELPLDLRLNLKLA